MDKSKSLYIDREAQEVVKKLQANIDSLTACLEVLPQIYHVLQSFDGKVIGNTLFKALSALGTDKVYVISGFYEYKPDSIKIEIVLRRGGSHLYGFTATPTCVVREAGKRPRFDYAGALNDPIDNLVKRQKECETYIEQWKKEIEEMPKKVAEYKRLYDEVKALQDGTSSFFRENLNFSHVY